MQKSARVAGWRCFQGDFLSVAFPGLKARLRKAFVAADSLGRTESRLRARRSVTKAAWAILCSPFGRLEHGQEYVQTADTEVSVSFRLISK